VRDEILSAINIPPELLQTFSVLLLVATAIVHVALAVGVLQDGLKLVEHRHRIYFLPPSLWALATLLTGVLGATAYWLMHCSTLRKEG
jgi:hypothetical protein